VKSGDHKTLDALFHVSEYGHKQIDAFRKLDKSSHTQHWDHLLQRNMCEIPIKQDKFAQFTMNFTETWMV